MKFLIKNIFFLLTLSISTAFAQTDSTQNLSEVLVTANKFEQNKQTLPYQIEQIKAKQIAFQNAPNTADLMMQTGQVFVQKSQAGGGSLVLRGFEANKVLMVIDGVRMNNAIYRGGHLQNALRIDQNALEAVETVFGPSSVIYGSDALGGVVHFRTKQPKLNQTQTQAYIRHAMAIQEKTVHADLNLGGKRWASFTSFTFSDFGDVLKGKNSNEKYPTFGQRSQYVVFDGATDVIKNNGNPNLQVGSAYAQADFLQKILFQTSEKQKHTFNFQYSNTSDVPRYDRLTDLANGKLRFAEWYYGPEKRVLVAYQLDLSRGTFYDKANLTLSYQDIQESRHSRRVGNLNRKNQIENVQVYAANLDILKNLSEKHLLQYGAEAICNEVQSRANNLQIITKIESPTDTRYPDGGSSTASVAAYLAHQWFVSPKSTFNTGVRYNWSVLQAKFMEKTFFPFPYSDTKQNNEATVANIGWTFHPSNKTKLGLLYSSGFRTPNIDDLAKIFESGAGTLIVPNPDLKPELTNNYEINFKHNFPVIKLEAAAYYTQIRDAIVVDAFALNGNSLMLYNGVLSKIVANQNRQTATIRGFFIGINANLKKNIQFKSNYNLSKGQIEDNKKTPLDHIPPAFGNTSLSYRNDKWQVEAFSLYNGAKKLATYSPSGEDNPQYATADGMPAWMTFNLRGSYALYKNYQIQLACENISDVSYRHFASGIHAAGRSFVFTLRGRW